LTYTKSDAADRLYEGYNRLLADSDPEVILPLVQHMASEVFPDFTAMQAFYSFACMEEKRFLKKAEVIELIPKYWSKVPEDMRPDIKYFLENIALAPRVFISYSHDSQQHKAWVLKLATHLSQAGIDIVFDQWDIEPGSDVALFMEQGIEKSDRVVLVITEKYVEKTKRNDSGTGYERMIITGQLAQELDTHKFIPITRQTLGKIKLPVFLGNRLYVDFSDDELFEDSCHRLLRTLHGEPEVARPSVGPNPFLKQRHEAAQQSTHSSSDSQNNSTISASDDEILTE